MATNNAVNTSLAGQTGTVAFVGSTSPTLVTPVLGVATATSIGNGGNVAFAFDTSGRFTTTNQPTFVLSTSTLTDVTGDGTDYQTVFTAENVDKNNNVAAGVFTVPVTGVYHFSANLTLTGLTVLHTSARLYFLAGGSGYEIFVGNIGAMIAGGGYSLSASMLLNMTAAQTVALQVQVSGSAKTVDITSASIWGGYLVG